ncbi:hypothetical protein [Salinispora pacifica]|uniref:hypothetical protein n=1 Tax=Salinispora pacifica TaxID=351187 RepID=UPI0004770687|nr:hypothetical protein [Salinispora pacifica]
MRYQDHDQGGTPERPARTRPWLVAGVAGLLLALVAPAAIAGPGTGIDEQTRPKGTPVPCDPDALIAAITLGNARGGAVLDLAKDCTYLLTADVGDGAGLPAITSPITLNGGKNTVIERAAAVEQFRILTVEADGDLTLNHLKITGGQTDEDGGGIFVAAGAALTLNHSRIVRNISAQEGGGIRNAGTATITHSYLERNTAGTGGGGVASTGVLDLRSSTVGENVSTNGGGISSAGSVVVVGSAITGNRATSVIGGGLLATGGSALLTDSQVLRNSSNTEGAGVVAISVQLHLRRVVIADNAARSGGGGLIINSTSSATVRQSLIQGNTANTDGGGVFNAGALALFDTEIRGNQATRGGGVYHDADGTLTLYTSTIRKNTAVADGGGIFNEAGGTVELNTATGTVVSANRPNNCVNVAGCPG